MLDLRALIYAEMVRQHGQQQGAQAALGARMAPRWGIAPDQARERLSRYFAPLRGARGTDMLGDPLSELLDELGFTVTANDVTHTAK